ncbi:MAG: RHS repeat-associated core domain-containing protein [Rubrivivax sp.]|nr:RHS repeat-associated core domain-containing protein [Rubrivivax sp.]
MDHVRPIDASRRRRVWLQAGLLAIALSMTAPATAQAPTPTIYEEQGQLVRGSRKVESLTSSLFGGQVSLYNGGVSFTQTDVSLPGNSALAVRIGRHLPTGAKRMAKGAFGDWDLDIPHLKGVFSHYDGWNVGHYYGSPDRFKRCSQFNAPADAPTQTGQAIVSNFEFWFGNHLYVPGSGEQELLRREAVNPAPTDGNSYPVVTKGGWAFRCIAGPLPRGQAGEGFVGVAPDGTQYRFDWLVSRPYAPFVAPGSQDYRSAGGSGTGARGQRVPGENAGMGFQLLRSEFFLLPTLVTDRYGNTVAYTYSATRPWRLERIAASDGRTIDLAYDATTDVIRSVTDGTRTWTYSYVGSSVLTAVTQPDAAQWRFYGDSLQVNPAYTPGYAPYGCGSGPANQGSFVAASRTMTMVHPSGAIGSFTLEQIMRGRSHVINDCWSASGAVVNSIPVFYLQRALTRKSLSGPGLSASTWTYTWDAHNGSLSPCAGCAETVAMKVTDPRGFVTRYTHGNRWLQNEGQLLKVEEGWNGQAALRVKTLRYRQSPNGDYPLTAGTPISFRTDGAMASKHLPLDRRQTTQQGVDFVWEASTFDTRVRPTVMLKGSSLGYQRMESTVYWDKPDKWILGQRASLTVSGGGLPQAVLTESISYDPVKAWPIARSVNGRPDQTFDFHADGTLKWIRDGAGQQTSYGDYKRGLARLIAYADGKSERVDVSDIGLVTAWTNAAGTTMQYGYDAMGRLNRVDYPPETGLNYHATTIGFQQMPAADKGLEGGHWQQTITTGNSVARSYFDALWRERLRVEYDAGNEAGTSAAVETRYDIDGRKTFETYPQRTISGVGAGTSGHWWEYDALGRELVHRQSSELSPSLLSTITEYLGDFRKRVTDPKGHASTFSYQAWDEPTEDGIRNIDAPEGVTVSIARDALGKPTSITRSGGGVSASRSYVYDAHERLCKTVEPESSATVQGYDAAGNVSWRASGQNFPGPGCETQVAGSSLISYGYDQRNRLLTTTYGDGSQNITRSYTDDGLLGSIGTNGAGVNPVTWSYSYNSRRLLTRERYTWGDANNGWDFNWGRDAYGHAASLSDPWGTVQYSPDALGRPTQVSGYASAVSYHPNGAVAGYTLGNGIGYVMTQNVRGLTALMQDGSVVRDRYAYDGNGNVTAITDETPGGVNSRGMTLYDGLDRLRQASGPWGAGSFGYDALDNLTGSTVGGRSLTHHIDPSTNRLTGISGSLNLGIGYDANGNIAQLGGQGFVFDIGNRMRSATGKATYAYDGHGRRNLVWFAGGGYLHQAYTKDGKLRFAWGSSQGGRRHVYLGNRLIAETTDGGVTTYAHTDGLGSPVAKTSNTGAVVSRTRYEPYGATVAGSTSPATIGYTGHVNDADTGLVYMQQRYYDPIAGRFLSVDPVTTDAKTGGHFNRYVYAESNPYKFTDPDGRSSIAADVPHEVGGSGNGAGIADVLPETVSAQVGSALAASATLAGGIGGGARGGIAAVQGIAAREISLSRSIHGEAAAHAADAIKAGKPSVLTIDRAGASANRQTSTGALDKVVGKHLDEYPPAMFREGGAGASVRPISPRDNMSSGACIGNACRGLPNGTRVQIKIGD